MSASIMPLMRDAAKAADQLRVVGDLLWAQHHPLAVEVHVVLKFGDAGLAQREGRGRGKGERAVLEQLQHAVLNNFGVGLQALVAPAGESGQHGVGDIAHPGLERQKLVRQPAPADLVVQEVQQVPGNLR